MIPARPPKNKKTHLLYIFQTSFKIIIANILIFYKFEFLSVWNICSVSTVNIFLFEN